MTGGGGPGRQRLRFNPHNATTESVDRLRDDDGTRIEKVLRRPVEGEDRHHWSASIDARHWNAWSREAAVYADPRLRASLEGTGLDLPAGEVVRGGPRTVLRLEDVQGRPGADFGLDDHVAFVTALGRWQARPLDPLPEWTSRGFLREYSTSRPADPALVDDDAAWAQPLIRATWPGELRDGWRRLLAHRERLLAVMEQLPRTLCHLDAWVANAIRRPDGRTVLLDWAFAGDGAVGEDLGNWLPDSVFDLFQPASRLPELETACLPAYLRGLRDRGWSGADDDVRLAVHASCVKYAWLLPAMLQGASAEEQHAYFRVVPAEELYRDRGIALLHLVRWCDDALDRIG